MARDRILLAVYASTAITILEAISPINNIVQAASRVQGHPITSLGQAKSM